MTSESESPTFLTRAWFAWVCFFRVLFDPAFASRAWAAREPAALPLKAEPEPAAPPKKPAPAPSPPEEAPAPIEAAPADLSNGALTLLSLLQTEGRFVDFVQQEIATFDDQDIGAAARVVHEGCRRVLKDRVAIEPIFSEQEGASVKLGADFDFRSIKLTGNVPKDAHGARGTLRHKGWRAKRVSLPTPTKDHAFDVLCPAEVEL